MPDATPDTVHVGYAPGHRHRDRLVLFTLAQVDVIRVRTPRRRRRTRADTNIRAPLRERGRAWTRSERERTEAAPDRRPVDCVPVANGDLRD